MKQRERERKSKKICEERRQTHRFYTQERFPCVGKRLFLAGLQGKVMEGRLVWNGCEKIYDNMFDQDFSHIYCAWVHTKDVNGWIPK